MANKIRQKIGEQTVRLLANFGEQSSTNKLGGMCSGTILFLANHCVKEEVWVSPMSLLA